MLTVNSRLRRLGVVAALAVAVAAPTACSSNHVTHGPPSHGLAGGADPAGDSGPGVAAKSLSCDRFGVDRLLSAGQQVVPASLVRVGQAPTDVSDGTLACGYEFYTDGTDLSSADYGMVQVSVEISDAWDQSVLLDGHDDDKDNAAAFADDRATSRVNYQGPMAGEAGATGTFVDVPDLGHGGYIEDVRRTADGVDQSWNTSLEILRTPRPYRVEIGLSYVVPRPDQSVPDTSLDDAMTDRSKRTALLRGVAAVVLGSMPS